MIVRADIHVCACNEHNILFLLSYVNGNAEMSVFVVKHYAMPKRPYAVRRLNI